MSDQGSDVKVEPVVITDEAKLAEIKSSIKCIEGLFNAVNAGSFPLRYYQQTMSGMVLLKQIHDQLLGQLSPEQIEQAKREDEESIRTQAMGNAAAGTPTTVQ